MPLQVACSEAMAAACQDARAACVAVACLEQLKEQMQEGGAWAASVCPGSVCRDMLRALALLQPSLERDEAGWVQRLADEVVWGSKVLNERGVADFTRGDEARVVCEGRHAERAVA